MNERTLEIIIRRQPEQVFGQGFKLVAQQLNLPSGRIDLLMADADENRHIIELKKGKASVKAVDQVLAYAADLKDACDNRAPIAWVVAHEIPAKVASYASGLNVKTKAVSLADCERIRIKAGLSDADLLGLRRDPTVISGGGPKKGLRNIVPNAEAYKVMPGHLAQSLRELESMAHFELTSGGMQSVVHYRGVKLGGVNRQHRGGHAYMTSHVVVTAQSRDALKKLGFKYMTKNMSGGYEHIWYEISWQEHQAFRTAIALAANLVDEALGLSSRKDSQHKGVKQ